MIGQACENGRNSVSTQRRITQDPVPIDSALSCLELWLDEQYPRGIWRAESVQHRCDDRQRDEGQVGNDEIEGFAEGGDVSGADIRSFDDGDPVVASNAPVHLAVADIDGRHGRSTSLEQAVREATSGCTDVDRSDSGDIGAPFRERSVELPPCATDERLRRRDDVQWFVGGYERGRFRISVRADTNETGFDRPTCLRPGLDEMPSNKLDVEPAARQDAPFTGGGVAGSSLAPR